MSLSPVIGTEVPEAANGVATPVSLENGPHAPVSVKYGGSRLPGNGAESVDGSGGRAENHVDTANRLHTVESNFDSLSLRSRQAADPSFRDGAGTGDSDSKDTDIPEASKTDDMVLMWDSRRHEELKEPCQQGGSDVAGRHQTGAERVERRRGGRGEEEDGETEKQDVETDEKHENRWRNTGGRTEKEPSQHYSSSAPSPSTSSSSTLQPAVLASDNTPCPPHVMAQVWVRNNRGMQDSKSLDEISQACGGGAGTRGGGRGGQSEGRRATISSALELEGTVSHEGDLTNFITKNLEQKIKMSSKPSLDCSDSDCSGPIYRSRGLTRRPADIPPIDPTVLLDLQRHTQELAHSVEMMMKSLNGTIQNMTALSVGYIQTYRDSVDSLGESVDMSIKGMYTLMARCEELDRSMQPIHTLAAQIRDIKRTLDALEALCK
ncbi:BLOC-1-related complex subunit 6 [Fundulus heteroclitus]|uniref:BLOC-1-related complex subunit 6 n=1 Tax=Fundulus heteroclitus TaxID=8078 RepID=UPI00165C5E75|nr:BLOC-1-related complex subunit 6 [Fundulus heteroclitus]XP_012722243.2 BLOC-1-related complex subunit 6 [Fundulus heteroclitus]XP_021174315.2 BLOC-1-related complex subunit 6 [Fundulus heteroclitus]